ncbi:sugar ABC transporter ATP-binding protein [Lysinibacillus sp. NPDC098008]|uniref:sugar ABC transporter ATP-binding protein n=1 Tax=Lysinibacillus sp. NPDC098008 TaxID=3364146 RepID=UPI00380B15A7
MVLKVENISKSFSGLQVLKDISFDVGPGEIHVLLGENGAGKSTIIKILTGAYQKDTGQVIWKGQPLEVSKPQDAIDVGIGTIYQELNLIPELSVMENIFLGHEIKKGILLDRATMRKKSEELLQRLGVAVSPDEIVGALGVGQQQLVEIAKALSLNCDLLIMDEPTASLSEREVEQLLKTVLNLQKEGMSFIYVSHRLEEIKRISNRITVLRDGAKIDTVNTAEISIDGMIALMVGRSLDNKFPKMEFKKGDAILEVKNLKLKEFSSEINFTAYRGEILGISGLVGAGRTELARAIFGADPKYSGTIILDGQEVQIKNPIDAINSGIAFITEDRKQEGLFLDLDLVFNKTIANLDRVSNGGLLNHKKQIEISNKYIKELEIRPNNIKLMARNLSGGNQQKVVIAKWLNTNAKLFIFDEPTRGIDVGAKVEVYNLMNALVERGAGVVVISSELPEILGISDRVLVMHEGEITADIPIEAANQEVIMKAATGGE